MRYGDLPEDIASVCQALQAFIQMGISSLDKRKSAGSGALLLLSADRQRLFPQCDHGGADCLLNGQPGVAGVVVSDTECQGALYP